MCVLIIMIIECTTIVTGGQSLIETLYAFLIFTFSYSAHVCSTIESRRQGKSAMLNRYAQYKGHDELIVYYYSMMN